MNAGTTSSLSVQPLVRLTRSPEGQFHAQVVGMSDVSGAADTREDALARVREKLAAMAISGELVPLDVGGEHPLLRLAGWASDEAEHEVYLDAIRRYREEIDAREADEAGGS